MISLRNLPMKNLRGYAGRTAALILFAMLMAVSVFGGTMVIGGVRQGLSTVQNRLGADIIVTPEEAGNNFDAQTVLLQAEPGYFYMDIEKMDEIAKVDGIDKISPQLFMASAEAGCCSAKLQMIAFDPKTDFTIQPWIADIRTDGEIGLMDVVIGSNVKAFDDSTISFYGNDCNIAGQFAPTGSTLDDCVYMNFDTVKVLIESSFEKNLNLYPPYDPDEVVSAVMIRVKPEADAEQVAQEIRDQVTGVNVSTSGNMVSGIGESLDKIEKTISVFAAVFWVIGMLTPTSGEVYLDGENIYSMPQENLARVRNEKIGLIPQGHTALLSLTILENVLLPFVLYHKENPPVEKAKELLETVGIASLMNAKPNELSGGELRRMAIARAMLMEPKVILADEPTAGLDQENVAQVLQLLRKAADGGKAVLMVTHESEAERYADRVLTMDGGKLV